MPSEEFHKIMAGMREREKRLYDDLAALEDESRQVIKDHRELLVAIENDQGPTRPPQHPVTEALNAFHSTQFVGPPAAASGAEAQPVEDEDSLFVPEDAANVEGAGNAGNSSFIFENAEESSFVPGNAEEFVFIHDNTEEAEQSHFVPQDAGNSLFMPDDARIDEPTTKPPPRPKRRVTFSDAPDTVFGAMSPAENLGSGDFNNTETSAVQSPSGDAHIGDNEPVYTVSAPVGLNDGNVNATQESLPLPVTSEDADMSFDDTNMNFNEPIYSAFAPISSEDGHVNAAQESPAFPVNPDDTIMGFDQPIYTGNRCPTKRVRHSARTSTSMHNTGFAPTLPDNKPASDPQGFAGTYNHQDLVNTYNAQNLAGTYNPQDLVGDYNSQDFNGSYIPQDYMSNYDPNIPAGGPIEPWQQEQYNNMTAESKMPDHVDHHFVCPYPDCGKLYVNSVDVEQHLKHHHPDWALIKDAVVASDTPNVFYLPDNW
ncbi:hypothetical protein KCU65_g5680, partial [Aureobasidium melanogenum]